MLGQQQHVWCAHCVCDWCSGGAEKAQRIASRLAAAKEEPTVNVHSTVNQLQSYLVANSHIRVFFMDTQSDDESVRRSPLLHMRSVQGHGRPLSWPPLLQKFLVTRLRHELHRCLWDWLATKPVHGM